MFKTFTLAGGVLLGAAIGASPALAEDGSCSCIIPISNSSTPVGHIAVGSGQVLASQTNGLLPAASGQPLFPGSQVVTGPNGSAELDFGGCQIAMVANTEISVFATGENICVQVNAPQTTPTNSSNDMTTALVGGGTLAGIAGLAFGLGGGDKPASN